MRDTKAIRKWMKENRWQQRHIQVALGLARHTPVWETIEGRRSDRRVLQFLIDNGCPKKILGLPQRMKEAA